MLIKFLIKKRNISIKERLVLNYDLIILTERRIANPYTFITTVEQCIYEISNKKQ